MDRRKFIKTVGIATGATLLSGMGIAGQRHFFPQRASAGLPGNTHFPMSDLNNAEVAELMYD